MGFGHNKAVFFDRDGTLIKHIPFLSDPRLVELSPGVPQALTELRRMGFLLIVVTNQSGVARGMYTESDVHKVNEHVADAIVKAGGPRLDAVYYCPHFPEGVLPEYMVCCDCRKPAPGMVLRAAAEHNINLSQSFIVGDTYAKDIVMGLALGMGTILFAQRGMPEPLGVLAVTDDFSEIPCIINRRRDQKAGLQAR